MNPVPDTRIQVRNDAPVHAAGNYVLYWMVASRRLEYNYALQRSIELAEELRKPLVILEALRVGYPWASDRLHRFVLDGMAEHAEALADSPVEYYPYVETEPGAGRGLLAAMAGDACAVVTDHYPCFFLPRMVDAAARHLDRRLESVDSNGLVPVGVPGRAFPTAYSFRRWLQKNLPPLLPQLAVPDPLTRATLAPSPAVDATLSERWPRAGELRDPSLIAKLPIDHGVRSVALEGGAHPARRQLDRFLSKSLARYGDRNQPETPATSHLSAYLHFGHIASQEVFSRILDQEEWSPTRISPRADGRRQGWWGMSEVAEGFLDQIVTWRELGFNGCQWMPDYDRFESLPPWAQTTLDEHAADERPHLYTLDEFEAARTHDPLWNAAQNQLRSEGIIHNYLRMLWGKKILHWSRDPEQALDIMLHLNNKYALDGRDPNSYSGIFWVLGRYDRAWGPERPVFGKIRYMSSANTARKVRVKAYVQRYSQTALI